MPKNKFEEVIFTIIMATVMVYGMVVYNVALNMGGVTNQTFLIALRELPIMVPIAFVLEFFIVGKIAGMLAFKVMRPTDRPQFIIYAISICICCIMCPTMSLVASILFNVILGGAPIVQLPAIWVGTILKNFPMAFFWNMFAAAPFTHLLFGLLFRDRTAA